MNYGDNMSNKVTLQDIADALGLSRNTVSRAINNSDSIAEATKKKIFQKAAEMGYKQFNLISPFTEPASPPLASGANEIALFTHSLPGNSHFGAKLLDTFQKKVSESGYKFSIYTIGDFEIDQLCFPANFNPTHTAGILCLELFSETYSDFLCNQEIPLLFVDTVFNHGDLNLQADLLYMENQTSVYLMLKKLIHDGYRNISFIGDRFHCQSFYERWKSYCAVMADHNIPINTDTNILDSDSNPYADTDWLARRIKQLPSLPDVFFCANDFLAISTLKVLKSMNISVPNDVMLCGFDNAPESVIVEPTLTTIEIPSRSMGFIAADLLISRISHPNMPYRTTHVKTDIIYRDSTNKKI